MIQKMCKQHQKWESLSFLPKCVSQCLDSRRYFQFLLLWGGNKKKLLWLLWACKDSSVSVRACKSRIQFAKICLSRKCWREITAEIMRATLEIRYFSLSFAPHKFKKEIFTQKWDTSPVLLIGKWQGQREKERENSLDLCKRILPSLCGEGQSRFVKGF